MSKIIKLFKDITSYGEVTIVQTGFLYEDRVDTREEKLTLKDFITLVRYFIENKYLEMRLKISGEQNKDKVFEELKKVGVSVEIVRNELNWIEEDKYEIDALLHLDLPTDKVQNLTEEFYVVRDAILVYPVGYKSY